MRATTAAATASRAVVAIRAAGTAERAWQADLLARMAGEER